MKKKIVLNCVHIKLFLSSVQTPSVFNGFAKYDWKKTMPEGNDPLLDMYKGWNSLVNEWP